MVRSRPWSKRVGPVRPKDGAGRPHRGKRAKLEDYFVIAPLETAAQVSAAMRFRESFYGPRKSSARYPKRPFMGPALARSIPRVSRFFR